MTCRFSSVGPTRVLASVSVVSRFRRWSSLRLNTIPTHSSASFGFAAPSSARTHVIWPRSFSASEVAVFAALSRTEPPHAGPVGRTVSRFLAVAVAVAHALAHAEGHRHLEAAPRSDRGSPSRLRQSRTLRERTGASLLEGGNTQVLAVWRISSSFTRWCHVHLLRSVLFAPKAVLSVGCCSPPSPPLAIRCSTRSSLGFSSCAVSSFVFLSRLFLQVWRVLDFLGHHRAACATAGVLG